MPYSITTREEEFIAYSTRHPMRVFVMMGGNKDGQITAIYMKVDANTGPYGNHALTVPMNSCSKTLPLFKCDNMKYDLTIYYTNTPPAGAYQGYGTPKGTYGLMMAMRELADKLGVDYKFNYGSKMPYSITQRIAFDAATIPETARSRCVKRIMPEKKYYCCYIRREAKSAWREATCGSLITADTLLKSILVPLFSP